MAALHQSGLITPGAENINDQILTCWQVKTGKNAGASTSQRSITFTHGTTPLPIPSVQNRYTNLQGF